MNKKSIFIKEIDEFIEKKEVMLKKIKNIPLVFRDKIKERIKIHVKKIGYLGRLILKDINISLAPKKSYFLLGRNGSGKSTLIAYLLSDKMIVHEDSYQNPNLENLAIFHFERAMSSKILDEVKGESFIELLKILLADAEINKEEKELISKNYLKYSSKFTALNILGPISSLSLGNKQIGYLLLGLALIDFFDIFIYDERFGNLSIENNLTLIDLFKEVLLGNKITIFSSNIEMGFLEKFEIKDIFAINKKGAVIVKENYEEDLERKIYFEIKIKNTDMKEFDSITKNIDFEIKIISEENDFSLVLIICSNYYIAQKIKYALIKNEKEFYGIRSMIEYFYYQYFLETDKFF